MRKYTRNLTLSALFLALGYVLPFLTGQIPQFGSMLLPMHIPVFLCGLICGWQYGAVIGFILPLTRCLFFSMPPVYVAIAMAFELATYGFVAGFLYNRSFHNNSHACRQACLGRCGNNNIRPSGQFLHMAGIHGRRIHQCHTRHNSAACAHPRADGRAEQNRTC